MAVVFIILIDFLLFTLFDLFRRENVKKSNFIFYILKKRRKIGKISFKKSYKNSKKILKPINYFIYVILNFFFIYFNSSI